MYGVVAYYRERRVEEGERGEEREKEILIYAIYLLEAWAIRP